ncbi:hypothetical protein [Neoroseomonas rubea]|uniref:hypothetical protein n=1 Tax=Neoroseomonas rubea TaxID=2748666 RepID=UPI0018DFC284|nr:hypothetical protein [Roseomonas rubea]
MLLVALLSVAGAGWAVRSANNEMITEALGRSLDRAEGELAAVGLRMRGHAAGLSVRPDLVRAVGAADAAAARDILVAAFTALRSADPAVAVVEATDAGGRVLIRGHNPARGGRQVPRAGRRRRPRRPAGRRQRGLPHQWRDRDRGRAAAARRG